MAVLLGSAYGKITIDTTGVKKSTQEAATGLKKFGQDAAKVGKVAASGMAALTAEVVILKKAFEFGRQGAEVAQMGESFDTLLSKVGAAPDMLDQLQRASKGTVDEMSLMASTALLLAGTQGKLATELARSSPELLEMAKAAQKLNPSLGDTTFLYDSLARGIKRSSPLILDNLGIIVKIEEANRKYAESLGIATHELTSEQQKIALLNEVLEKGDILIEQAGGSAVSATDSFDRMTAAIKDQADAFKADLFPALAQSADAVYYLLTAHQQLKQAVLEHEEAVREDVETYEDYIAELERAAEVAGYMIDQEGNLVRMRRDGGRVTLEVVKANYALIESEWGVLKSLGATEKGFKKARDAAFDARQGLIAYGWTLDELQTLMSGEMGAEMKNFTESSADLEKKVKDITEQIGELSGNTVVSDDQVAQVEALRSKLTGVRMEISQLKEKIDDGELGFRKTKEAKNRIEELKQKAGELAGQIQRMGEKPYLTEEQKKQLKNLREELGTTKQSLEELNLEHEKNTKGILFNMLQGQLDAAGMLDLEKPENQANVDLINNLAVKWGLVDQATADAMQAAKEATGIIAASGADAEEAAGRVDTYYAAWQALNSLDQIKNFSIRVNMELSEQRSVFGNGSLGGNYGNNGGITLDPNRTPRAGGGPVFGGMSYPWNEPTARPEILIPTGNGYVLNRQQAQEALAMAARGPQMAGGLSIAPGAIQVVGAPGMSEEFLGETLMRKIERDYGVLAGLRSKGRR